MLRIEQREVEYLKLMAEIRNELGTMRALLPFAAEALEANRG
jgi:hypothetical protein